MLLKQCVVLVIGGYMKKQNETKPSKERVKKLTVQDISQSAMDASIFCRLFNKTKKKDWWTWFQILNEGKKNEI